MQNGDGSRWPLCKCSRKTPKDHGRSAAMPAWQRPRAGPVDGKGIRGNILKKLQKFKQYIVEVNEKLDSLTSVKLLDI